MKPTDTAIQRIGRNIERDWRRHAWSNATHASVTDPHARLMRKGKGKPAQVCYMGHALMENRHGFIVETELTRADGYDSGDLVDGDAAHLGVVGSAARLLDPMVEDAPHPRVVLPHQACGSGERPLPVPHCMIAIVDTSTSAPPRFSALCSTIPDITARCSVGGRRSSDASCGTIAEAR